MYTGKRRAVNWERTRAEGRKSEDAIEGKVEVGKEQKCYLRDPHTRHRQTRQLQRGARLSSFFDVLMTARLHWERS